MIEIEISPVEFGYICHDDQRYIINFDYINSRYQKGDLFLITDYSRKDWIYAAAGAIKLLPITNKEIYQIVSLKDIIRIIDINDFRARFLAE